jgi:hypothetical protein
MYINGKMRPVGTLSGMEPLNGVMMEGVNSTMIYCENLYKYHTVPPVQQQQQKKER